MGDVASVLLKGRLTRDPEIRFSDAGKAVVKVGLAVEYQGAKDKEVSFFDVVIFGKRGERLAEQGKKGTSCAVIGRLRQNRWEQEGVKRSRVEVIANDAFVESTVAKQDTEQNGAVEQPPPEQDDIPF